MKRFRDMTYWGGNSSKEARSKPVIQTRYRLIRPAADGAEAEYETYTENVPRQEASWVACMKMQVAADLLAAARPQQMELDRRSAKCALRKRARSASRDSCKVESIACIENDCLPVPPAAAAGV
jgi:hypothetical protein